MSRLPAVYYDTSATSTEYVRDWREDAECLDEDPELFFPVGNTGPALLQIGEAKAVCRRCQSAQACLAWALKTDQRAGIWGGHDEGDLRRLKARIKRAADRATRAATDESWLQALPQNA